MTHKASIAGILAAHLAGALLLVATGAQAGGAMQHLHHRQQTSLRLGDSKCIVVGEVLKCVPTIVASN